MRKSDLETFIDSPIEEGTSLEEIRKGDPHGYHLSNPFLASVLGRVKRGDYTVLELRRALAESFLHDILARKVKDIAGSRFTSFLPHIPSAVLDGGDLRFARELASGMEIDLDGFVIPATEPFNFDELSERVLAVPDRVDSVRASLRVVAEDTES